MAYKHRKRKKQFTLWLYRDEYFRLKQEADRQYIDCSTLLRQLINDLPDLHETNNLDG